MCAQYWLSWNTHIEQKMRPAWRYRVEHAKINEVIGRLNMTHGGASHASLGSALVLGLKEPFIAGASAAANPEASGGACGLSSAPACYAVCFLTPVCVAHTANHPYADVGWRKLRELNSTLHEKIVNMAIRYGYDDTELLAEKKLIDSGRGGEWGRTSAVSIVRPLLLFVSVRALPHTSSRFSPPPSSTPSQAHAEKRDNDLQNLLVQAEEDNAEMLEGEAVMIEPVDGCVVERGGGAAAALVLHPLSLLRLRPPRLATTVLLPLLLPLLPPLTN
jgi:hypothetical protein